MKTKYLLFLFEYYAKNSCNMPRKSNVQLQLEEKKSAFTMVNVMVNIYGKENMK